HSLVIMCSVSFAVNIILIVATIALVIYITTFKSVNATKDSGDDYHPHSQTGPNETIPMTSNPSTGLGKNFAPSRLKVDTVLSLPRPGYEMKAYSYVHQGAYKGEIESADTYDDTYGDQEAIYESEVGNTNTNDDQEPIYEGELGNTNTYDDQEPIYEGEVGNTAAPIGNQYYEAPTKFRYGH
ncbi:unnamed protein product, partial [Meganyctiphanes norvegica]